MERYDFKLRREEETVIVFRSVALEDLRAVWAMVASMARDVGNLGGRIVVTNQDGEVVILVGVATAQSYCVQVKEGGVARAAA